MFCPDKQRYFEHFMCFRSCVKTLAVILLSFFQRSLVRHPSHGNCSTEERVSSVFVNRWAANGEKQEAEVTEYVAMASWG